MLIIHAYASAIWQQSVEGSPWLNAYFWTPFPPSFAVVSAPWDEHCPPHDCFHWMSHCLRGLPWHWFYHSWQFLLPKFPTLGQSSSKIARPAYSIVPLLPVCPSKSVKWEGRVEHIAEWESVKSDERLRSKPRRNFYASYSTVQPIRSSEQCAKANYLGAY